MRSTRTRWNFDGEEREVKLENMIEDLRWIKDDWPNYTPTALVKVAEHDGVWIGTFNVEKIELNHETHTVEFVCEGKRTNFMHNHDKDNHK